MCASKCKHFLCLFIIFVHGFMSIPVWMQQSVRICVQPRLCVHLLCIMLTDSEDPLHTQLSLALFSSQVRSAVCTTALLSMVFIISAQAYTAIRRAKWRWYVLYSLLKLLSRHRTQGSDCKGWMLTRAKRLSVQGSVYPQLNRKLCKHRACLRDRIFDISVNFILEIWLLCFAKWFKAKENPIHLCNLVVEGLTDILLNVNY